MGTTSSKTEKNQSKTTTPAPPVIRQTITSTRRASIN
ncbi:unnamed protein product, partial [Rotaria sordida]